MVSHPLLSGSHANSQVGTAFSLQSNLGSAYPLPSNLGGGEESPPSSLSSSFLGPRRGPPTSALPPPPPVPRFTGLSSFPRAAVVGPPPFRPPEPPTSGRGGPLLFWLRLPLAVTRYTYKMSTDTYGLKHRFRSGLISTCIQIRILALGRIRINTLTKFLVTSNWGNISVSFQFLYISKYATGKYFF